MKNKGVTIVIWRFMTISMSFFTVSFVEEQVLVYV